MKRMKIEVTDGKDIHRSVSMEQQKTPAEIVHNVLAKLGKRPKFEVLHEPMYRIRVSCEGNEGKLEGFVINRKLLNICFKLKLTALERASKTRSMRQLLLSSINIATRAIIQTATILKVPKASFMLLRKSKAATCSKELQTRKTLLETCKNSAGKPRLSFPYMSWKRKRSTITEESSSCSAH